MAQSRDLVVLYPVWFSSSWGALSFFAAQNLGWIQTRFRSTWNYNATHNFDNLKPDLTAWQTV